MAVFQRIKNAFKAVSTVRKALAGADFVPLEEALGGLFQQADFVHLADTDHREEAIPAWLSEAQNLQKLHDLGVRTIYLEELRPFQACGDGLAAGDIDVGDFARLMDDFGARFIFRDNDKALRQEGELIVRAAAAGIKVIFADPSNGREELAALKDYCESAGLGRNFIFSRDCAEKAKKIGAVPPGVAAEFERLQDAWLKVRHDDKETVGFMKDKAAGKALIIYGAGHDFTPDFAALGATARKISVFATAKAYGQFMQAPSQWRLGEAVYLMDQGMYCAPRALQAPAANENKPGTGKAAAVKGPRPG